MHIPIAAIPYLSVFITYIQQNKVTNTKTATARLYRFSLLVIIRK